MAIIATGAKTIIDLSDGKALSIYLGSNLPRTQIYDVNSTTYSIDWTSSPYLIVTPVIYINQTAVNLTDAALSLTFPSPVTASSRMISGRSSCSAFIQ